MQKKSPGKKLKVAFAADPIEHFNPKNETTFFIMHELSRRGWDSWHFELKDLFVKDTKTCALLKKVSVTKKNNLFSYKILDEQTIDLSQMHAIFLRKDPPVDLNFIDHLSLLEILNNKVLMINNPTSIKFATEKIFPLHFKGITPRTLVTQSTELIRGFVKKEKIAIIKVLNQAGGRGVIKVSADDTSLNSIIETLSDNQNRFIMAQQYLPEAKKGDKRILLLDGEIIGTFLRVPPKKDFRGNLHSGAKIARCTITRRDHFIVNTIKDRLKALGLYFVGIDVIGDYCTEINTTSPMGVGEINHNDNSQIEKVVVSWLQSKINKPSPTRFL